MALLSSCLVATPTFNGDTDPTPLGYQVMTLDGVDTYTYARSADTLTISASTSNTGGNLRQVYFPLDAPLVSDEASCETWEDGSGINQKGIALRIAPNADGHGWRAITVTMNVWGYAFYLFNVHVWNTATFGYQAIASFDLSDVVWPLDAPKPYPWHVCARTVEGLFQFKVWTGADPEPSWQDANRVYQVALPDGWDYPGFAGWYIGHLGAGDVNHVSDLDTWSLQGTVDPPTTAPATTAPATTAPATTAPATTAPATTIAG